MGVTLPKPELENNSIDGWPSTVDMKVILPGLVHYEDLVNSNGEHVGGNVLVRKEAFDRMLRSIEGKPIINWDHRKVDPKDFAKGRAQGLVEEMRFNEKWDDERKEWVASNDGWYHAKGHVWDESTRKNIENGFSISCAYMVSEWGEGGTHNKVPYEREVLNGVYTHIAVVPVPRYEGARIELLNSGGNPMGLLSFFRKDKPEEKVEFDPATAVVPVEGSGDITLGELINSFKARKAAEPKKMGLEDLIEVDGQKVSVKELLNAHQEHLVNSMKEDHEEGKHKDSQKENCAMCNSDKDEKDKKDKEERENSAKAEAAKKAEELANAAKEKADKEAAATRAKELDEMRNKGSKVEMPKIKTLNDLMADGQERYGGKETARAK